MARKVKCRATGEYGTTDTFVKIDGLYYKSQEVYEKMMSERKWKEKIKDIIVYDFLGYSPEQPFPVYVTKKLNELNYYSYEVIYRTIEEKRPAIEYGLSHKDFRYDSGKINYIFAIINNHINDVNKEFEEEQKEIEQLKGGEKTENPDLLDIPGNDAPKQKTKNISQFLEE